MEELYKEIEDTWNRHAEGYDEKHNAAEDKQCWKSVLKKLAGQSEGKTLLDIGTGTGFLALLASEAGYHAVGIDLSPIMIDAAKKASQEKGLETEFRVGNWEYLPFEDESFDVIVNRCVLWTLLNSENTLAEWKRVLKPDGIILCFCPNMNNREWPSHYIKEIEVMLKLKDADQEEFINILSSCGYYRVEIIEVDELKATELFKDWYVVKGRKSEIL